MIQLDLVKRHLIGAKKKESLISLSHKNLFRTWIWTRDIPSKKHLQLIRPKFSLKILCSFFFLWRCGPTRAMNSSFTRFLDHTQRRFTVGRTALDEWSARRRDLYLTAQNTQNRQTSMPPGGIRTHNLSRRAAEDLRLRSRGHCEWQRFCAYRFEVLWLLPVLPSSVRLTRGIVIVNNTEILCITHTVEHNYVSLNTVGNTTTCFGHIGGPSSGCNLDLEINYIRCVWGGNEISLFQY